MKSVLLLIVIATDLYGPARCNAQAYALLEFDLTLFDKDKTQWNLQRHGKDLLFRGPKRPRRTSDKEGSLAAGGTINLYIELADGRAPRRLRRNHLVEDLVVGGPYALSMEKLLDSPQGYLMPCSSTDPPTVQLDMALGRDAHWTFEDAGKYSQAYIKYERDSDAPMWLSLADSGFVRPGTPKDDQEMVFEFRRPALTKEKEYRIYVDRHFWDN